jgi:NADH-quinone oxidoreductase subunit J
MQDVLFYLFASLAVISGFLVVANPFSRNAVTSAMFLVLTIVWLAGLYVLLNAFFLAAVQILVYAGAVMVLFLFVIMMLNPDEEEQRRWRKTSGFLGTLAAVLIAALLSGAICGLKGPAAFLNPGVEGAAGPLGKLLLLDYLLPFEIVSVLLLVAVAGVVLLSKKNLK